MLARSERSVSQVRTVCQPGQNGLSARSERSVSQVRTVCKADQNGLSARSERSVSQVRTVCQPYFLTLCVATAICFPHIYKHLNVQASLLLITTFVCAASHVYGSQDCHLHSTIISTISCDARPCVGDKTTNHKTGFRQPSLAAWQACENLLSRAITAVH